MAKNSLSIVTNGSADVASSDPTRDSLELGDLFSLVKDKHKGRVYMHSGVRTQPPSAGSTNNKRFNDRPVIGYQSIIVKGSVSSGEDGTIFTTDGSKTIVRKGHATIELHLDT